MLNPVWLEGSLVMAGDSERLLQRARTLAAGGDDEAAKEVYLTLLRQDPTHCAALTELGALAQASGHVSAARTAYRQAVQHHPANATAQVALANLLHEDGDLAAAQRHYQAALRVAPDLPQAHQGLARVLTELGDPGAEPHWQRGFSGHSVSVQRFRGTGAGIPLLLLVSARGGNVRTQAWVDNRVFAVTAIHAEFHDPAAPLPPHAVVLNAIGDADLGAAALDGAASIVARSGRPVINAPGRVRLTGRATLAQRLAGLPGLVVPETRTLRRDEMRAGHQLRLPVLLRSPGFHTGQHFVRVETPADVMTAAATLPGETLLAIDYLDARGADGMARKYRVMFIDGAMYPLHLAISADWKVHYFTAAMAANADFRAEEQRFLDDMPSVLGARAMRVLADIQAILGLDYGGIDFGLTPDGSVLLFEANAPMVIVPPEADPIWRYRRAPIDAALQAARRTVTRRIPELAGAGATIVSQGAG